MARRPNSASAVEPAIPWIVAPEAWPGTQAVELWMDIGTEAWGFVAERVRADVEMQHALLRCSCPMQAQVVLMRHGHRAIEDYHREAGRMMDLLHRSPALTALAEG